MMYVLYEPVASGIRCCFGLKACHKAGNPDIAAVGRVGRAAGSSRTWWLVLGSMWVVEEGTYTHRDTYKLHPVTLTLAECSGNEWSRRDEEDTGKVQELGTWDTWDRWELRAAEDTWFESCWYSIHFFHFE